MSKENVKGVRHVLPSAAPDGLGERRIELVPKEGTTIDQAVKDYARAWGVREAADIDEAAKWDQALTDLEAGLITQRDFELGRNPERGEEFRPPRSHR